MSPFILLALLFGGEDSLSGYVSPEQYWDNRGVAVEVETLSAFLNEEAGVSDAGIEKWVTQLGAEHYADREAASRALAEIGKPAHSRLTDAVGDRDPEVSHRAKDLLRKIAAEISAENPLDEWMALYSLSRMKSPDARAVLDKILAGPEGERKEQVKALGLRDQDDRTLSSGVDSLSGFPEDTRIVLQMKPHKGDAAVSEVIHRSPAIQERLMELLAQIGDVKLHRMTVGLNEGIFNQDHGRVCIRAEADYDSKKLMTLLEKAKWEKTSSTDEVVIYRRKEMTLVFGDNRHLLLLIDLVRGSPVVLKDLTSFLTGEGDLLISENLQRIYKELPEISRVRGAGEFSGEMMNKLEDFSVVRDARFHIEGATFPFDMDLVLSTIDAETAKAFGAYATQENNKILELLRNENEEWVRPMRATLETLKISEDGNQVKLDGTISSEVVVGTVRMFENMLEQMQRAREMRLQQMQQREHMMIRRNGEIIF